LPPLCIGYILAALAILVMRRSVLPTVLTTVLREAFSLRAAAAGGMGFGISRAVRVGFARAVFSGEAGCGTSPMAYAAGSGRDPETQGLLGMAEVAIDTLLCTLTALALLTVSPDVLPAGSMNDIIAAFGACLGDAAAPLLAVAVFVFAFATVLAWAHYLSTALGYLGASARATRLFLLFYAVCLVPGACLPSAPVYAAADLSLALLSLLNAAALAAAVPIFRKKESKKLCFCVKFTKTP
jgi:AGCS family alanine or glycine:cation symporter